MLRELQIDNVAVIEKADVSFQPGLNVITGETGAGKSIVIDAINAVLGERTNKDLIRSGAEKAVVTAVFDTADAKEWLKENDIDADDEIILQRKIASDGKTSCRICGVPVSVSQLKSIGNLLVDIHGQNDGRQLLDESRHLQYLDRFSENDSLILSYQDSWRKLKEFEEESRALDMDQIEKERLTESLQYQIRELERADIRAGERGELTERRNLLRNSEKLEEWLQNVLENLSSDSGACITAQNAAYSCRKAAGFSVELESAAEKIESAGSLLGDAEETIRDFLISLDYSSDEYDRLEERLQLIHRLERKYRTEADDLTEYLDSCRKKLDEIEFADERLRKLRAAIENQKRECCKKADALHERRVHAGKDLQTRIQDELRELNMPSARFFVEILPLANEDGINATGCDSVRFLIAANPGEQPGRISRIASGGELSRIMLAMKNVLARNDPVPVMIFDEIDTGVSGITAQRVGEKLYSVSLGKQVFCVTHLPQIAAMADQHYLIVKKENDSRTYTEIFSLDEEARKKELARLHGGENITETTLLSAGEQLEAANHFKTALSKEKKQTQERMKN